MDDRRWAVQVDGQIFFSADFLQTNDSNQVAVPQAAEPGWQAQLTVLDVLSPPGQQQHRQILMAWQQAYGASKDARVAQHVALSKVGFVA